MDLNVALKAHGEWRLKFRIAIGKQQHLDARHIAADDCCPLGQWLHGEARKHFSDLPAYTECLRQHALFHREAAKVANSINAKRYREAEVMLLPGSAYAQHSTAFGVAVIRLRSQLYS
ncbi:hypothetical protein GCM10007860_31720 [Chitiniphilus shinanonensis]|uniref:Chemoreceptor zinc-binding domain-containing protein n=1 Tax=Chitiniphilus shinanonensis TaxID=553088 RepID=A0ABQ6BVJ3_9NEIS|nr:CZB domain-containing protein [Chitiniphilus shinanonensis]GLS06008.1 hypothetical protein GCM10007860_31720 [Chitiniphilus shinanonensis]